jgi:hypothetical protein
MATQSNPHFFTIWAKERLDEMDAAVTSLEGKIAEVQADVRDKAKKILADLRKQRDDFRDTMKKQSEAKGTSYRPQAFWAAHLVLPQSAIRADARRSAWSITSTLPGKEKERLKTTLRRVRGQVARERVQGRPNDRLRSCHSSSG